MISRYQYNDSTNKIEEVQIGEDEKTNMKIATGMSIQKDGKTVARTVIFGDVDGDGLVDGSDVTFWEIYKSGDIDIPDSIKISMDVNGDSKINETDLNLLNDYTLYGNGEIDQNR